MLFVLLILVPLSAALVVGLLDEGPRRWLIGVVQGVHLLGCGIALRSTSSRSLDEHTRLGDWPRGVAIELGMDNVSAGLLAVTSLLFVATWLWNFTRPETVDLRPRAPAGALLALLGACSGAFVARDLFHLFVWLEVSMVATFAIIAIETGRAGRSAWLAYLSVNVFSSALFILGIALVVGRAGTLDFQGIAASSRATPDDPVWWFAWSALATALLIKSSAFPMGAVLGQTYPLLSWPTAALFGGLLTKVGVYGLLRLSTQVLPGPAAASSDTLVVLACATMLFGVLGAAASSSAARILSYHVVSQVGYLLLGIALGGGVAIAATVFYTLHHMVVKAALFFACGAGEAVVGRSTVGAGPGVLERDRAVALAFAVPALSLAGIPLLSGFWAKFALIRGTVIAGHWPALGFCLGVGVLTLYSMVKVWSGLFATGAEPAEPDVTRERSEPQPRPSLWPAVVLAAVSVWIGLFPRPLWQLSERAAQELLAPGPRTAVAKTVR